MKTIITVQHTQSIQHTNGMIGSWTDWELTDLGKAHAENIGRKLSAELQGQEYKIYSSDLIRAKQTTEPLARYMGIPIIYLEKLREHYMGEAVGKTKQWAKENSLPVNSFDDRQFPGAESWSEFWNRVTNLWNEILTEKNDKIILVSHGGTLAVLHQLWRCSELQYCKFGAAGSVSILNINNNGENDIKCLNDLSYMESSK